MLIAGIIGRDGKSKTASLINSILSSAGKKTRILETSTLAGLNQQEIGSCLEKFADEGVDALVLEINFSDMEKVILKCIHFDIMIYNDKADDIKGNNFVKHEAPLKEFYSLLDENGIAIVNVDDCELIQLLQGMKYYIVTYGFNTKASMTASSVGDIVCKDNFMCCLQRSITAKTGVLVEPQEYKIRMERGDIDAYNVLPAVTFAVVNGIDLNTVDYIWQI